MIKTKHYENVPALRMWPQKQEGISESSTNQTQQQQQQQENNNKKKTALHNFETSNTNPNNSAANLPKSVPANAYINSLLSSK